jgi:hypothetical protein
MAEKQVPGDESDHEPRVQSGVARRPASGISTMALAELTGPVNSRLLTEALARVGGTQSLLRTQVAQVLAATSATHQEYSENLAPLASGPLFGMNEQCWREMTNVLSASPALQAFRDRPELFRAGQVPARLLGVHAGLGARVCELVGKMQPAWNLPVGTGLPSFVQLADGLAAAGVFKNFVTSDAALARWREGLFGAGYAAAFASTSALRFEPRMNVMLGDLTGAAKVTSRLVARAAEANLLAGAGLRLPSRRPTKALGRYLHTLPMDAGASDVIFGINATKSVAGLLAIDVAASDLDEVERGDALKEFEAGIVVSWRAGPARVRERLLSMLGGIRPELPDLLEGAWDTAQRRGPAADVMFSTCGVEVLDRTLRALAPTQHVLDWHARTGRTVKEPHNGGPTRTLRVRYVLRDEPDPRVGRLAVSQAEAIAAQVAPLHGLLEAGKHASAFAMAALEAQLLSVEALLYQLLLIADELPRDALVGRIIAR